MIITETIIKHEFKRRTRLTNNEYCVCDIVDRICTNERESYGGWSTMTRDEVGLIIGITRQATLRLVTSLVERGFLKKHFNGRYLKTTEKWREKDKF